MIRMIQRKIFQSRKYYRRLFAALFVIFSITIGILIYFINNSFVTKYNTEQRKIASDDLDTISRQFTAISSEIDTLYSFLLTNSTYALKYLTGADQSPVLISNLSKTIENVSCLSPYISSIVLYDYMDDLYLSNNDSLDMHLFLQSFFFNSLENFSVQATKQRDIFFYHFQASPESDEKNCLSMIYYTFNKSINKYYCVVFNLDAAKVGNTVLTSTVSPSCIVNGLGSVAASHISYPSSSNLVPYDWILKASHGSGNGYFLDTQKDTTYSISYKKLDDSDWYCFVKNMPKTSRITFTPYLVLYVLGDLFCAFIFTYLVVTALYSPVNRALNKFNQIMQDSETRQLAEALPFNHDEFTYINTVVSSLSEQLQVTKQESQSQLTIIKKAFLRTLLRSKAESASISTAWYLYETDLIKDSIHILLLNIDMANGSAKEPVLSFSSAVELGAERYLKNLCTYEVIDLNDRQYILLYSFPADAPDETLFLESIQTLQNWISVSSNCVLTVVIDEKSYDAASLHHGFKAVYRLLKEQFVLGYGHILSQSHVDTTLSTLTTYPDDLLHSIIDSVKARNRDQFINQYDNLTEFLSNYVYPDVLRVLIHLIIKMTDAMRSITVHNQYLNIDFSSIDELFRSAYTLKETKIWFIQLFDQYLSVLQESSLDKNEAYWKAIQQAQKGIQEHYSDPSLSIEKISEHVGYSSNYFSKIFKNLTGIYLKDYIKNIRISHAKQLLSETDLTISEISNMCGFLTQNYFFAAFKKELGITPSAYRNQHKQA